MDILFLGAGRLETGALRETNDRTIQGWDSLSRMRAAAKESAPRTAIPQREAVKAGTRVL
jgi:hypothetical protein